MACRRWVMAMTAVGVFAATPARAQDPAAQAMAATVDAQRRITIVFPGATRSIRGFLVRLDDKTLVVELDNHAHDGAPARVERVFPLSSIKRVDAERHDSVINGAILGALYVAACAKWWCAQGTSGGAPPNPWLGAGLGALLGASIDAAFYGRTPIWEAKPRTSAGLRPAIGWRFSF